MLNRKKRCSLFVICLLALPQARAQMTNDNLQYIRTEIGGVGHLLVPTRPTIQQPYQMMRMTPIRRDYLDDQISSFPLLVVSHRLGEVFSMLPSTDDNIDAHSWDNKLSYDQDEETRTPWFYSNYFPETGLYLSYTPGRKTGYYRFAFPSENAKSILLGKYNNKEAAWSTGEDNSLTGMQYFNAEDGLQPVKVFLYGKFNHSFVTQKFDKDRLALTFGKSINDTITFRYAVSFISAEQAKRNYNNELNNTVSYGAFAQKARQSWVDVMSQIQVEGGTEDQRRSFYTALYRCYERMVDITEDGQYYSGYDNKIHKDNRPFYVDDWTWDTYLALHPLRTLLQPQWEADMMQSYVRMYQQSGWVPTFPVIYGDHACMNGFHSTVAFLDAYRKGLKNFDIQTAYEGAYKNATQATMLPWRNGPAMALDRFYYDSGYFPALHPDEKEPYSRVNGFEKRQAVAITLGGSYDDWAVGQLAKDLGKYQDTALFAHRAKNYKNLWDDNKKFFMPKDSTGKWIDIDPAWDGGPGGRDYYDENNGWTYMWQVQHDVPGLIGLMHGKQGFEKRLDELFRADLGREKKLFWVKFTDATGLVGQYSMGNEPSFHIPYLYNFTDAPWKTQQRIRVLLKTWFDDNIFGIPGDEDGGGMSAFVVFSMMGFYPLTPGNPAYTIGSPVFNKISIQLKNGKTFTIKADGCSETNKYIQSAIMNGKTLAAPWFTHDQLVNGCVLELKMGARPNKGLFVQ
ncbi:MAG: GH92 family glycosyl hydrolase [Chitinophagaceae bacterium]